MKIRVRAPLGVEGARVVPLGERAAVHVPFTAECTNDELTIRLTIDVRDDRPVCTRYEVEAPEGVDLLLRTTEVARGYKIRRLAASALAAMALERLEPDDPRRDGRAGFVVDIGHVQYTSGASLETIEEVIGPVRSRREPVTDERLQAFAEAFQRDYVPGAPQAFAESQYMSERQMWRLVALARKRGFLPPKEEQ